jgi:hypothetical protein
LQLLPAAGTIVRVPDTAQRPSACPATIPSPT